MMPTTCHWPSGWRSSTGPPDMPPSKAQSTAISPVTGPLSRARQPSSTATPARFQPEYGKLIVISGPRGR